MPYKYLDNFGWRTEFKGLLTLAEVKTLAKNTQIKTLQFGDPVDPRNWKLLEQYFFSKRHDVNLRAYGHYFAFCNLSFLEEIPSLRHLSVECRKISKLEFLENLVELQTLYVSSYEMQSFDFLQLITPALKSLGLGQTKSKKPDLLGILRFPKLVDLHVGGQQKNLQVIAELKAIKELSLNGLSSPDIFFLRKLPKLEKLSMFGGGAKDLSQIVNVAKLKFLHLQMIRGLSDIEFLSECVALQELRIENLQQVKKLPDFQHLKRLKALRLFEMKGLTNVESIASAPALTKFAGSGAKLVPGDFQEALRAPKLKMANFYFGSLKKNAEFEQLAKTHGISTAHIPRY